MPEVFVDTGGWAAFFVRSEPYHKTANALVKGWLADRTLAVTTNYVLSELVALFTRPLRLPRTRQIGAIEAVHEAPWVEVVHIDEDLHRAAWSLLKDRPDKSWSLVDCASFVVMTRRGIRESLTADHHFEQAGFLRLLK
jgi:predicted nucleic acid-binding protein